MPRETRVVDDTAANLGWLREAREKLHWSKKTVGLLVGTTPATITTIENGTILRLRGVRLTITVLARMALWARTLRGRVYLLEMLEECKAVDFKEGMTQAIFLQRIFERAPPESDGS